MIIDITGFKLVITHFFIKSAKLMEDKILNNVKNHIGWGEKSQNYDGKKKQSENNDGHKMPDSYPFGR